MKRTESPPFLPESYYYFAAQIPQGREKNPINLRSVPILERRDLVVTHDSKLGRAAPGLSWLG